MSAILTLTPDEPEPKRRLSVVTVENVQTVETVENVQTVETVENVQNVYDYNGFNERSDTTTLTFCHFAQDFRF